MKMYDKIVLEVVGYDETHWQVRFPHIIDECFWIPKESYLQTKERKDIRKKGVKPDDSY